MGQECRYRNRGTKNWNHLPGMEQRKTSCFICGAPQEVGVMPGKDTPKVTCSLCITAESPDSIEARQKRYGVYNEERGNFDLRNFIVRHLGEIVPSRVKIYRPGDPGFNRVAAECTHISMI